MVLGHICILYNGTTSILKPRRVSKIFTVLTQKYLNIYKNVEVIIFNFDTKILIKLSEIINHYIGLEKGLIFDY